MLWHVFFVSNCFVSGESDTVCTCHWRCIQCMSYLQMALRGPPLTGWMMLPENWLSFSDLATSLKTCLPSCTWVTTLHWNISRLMMHPPHLQCTQNRGIAVQALSICTQGSHGPKINCNFPKKKKYTQLGFFTLCSHIWHMWDRLTHYVLDLVELHDIAGWSSDMESSPLKMEQNLQGDKWPAHAQGFILAGAVERDRVCW